jgi:hypothetical protein
VNAQTTVERAQILRDFQDSVADYDNQHRLEKQVDEGVTKMMLLPSAGALPTPVR